MLTFETTHAGQSGPITDLFTRTFTASEGAEEGAVIGAFVAEILASTDPADLFVATAWEDGALVGAAVFSRVTYAEDARHVFILSPMAVAPGQQGQGTGQALLRFALETLRDQGVDVALTYGDIRFYAKVGYALISEDTAKAPLPLSYPEGWLGQSLTGGELTPLRGAPRCVAALNDPALW